MPRHPFKSLSTWIFIVMMNPSDLFYVALPFRKTHHISFHSSVDGPKLRSDFGKMKLKRNRVDKHFYMKKASTLTMDNFSHILEALIVFKRKNGHLEIPSNYVISDGEGPEDLWGMRLGKEIEKILNDKENYSSQYPDRVQLLRNLGLDLEAKMKFSVKSENAREKLVSKTDWAKFFDGMKIYQKIYGNSKVNEDFIVPYQEPWSQFVQGFSLGKFAEKIRKEGKSSKDESQLKMLEEINFDFEKLDMANEKSNSTKVDADLCPFEHIFEAMQIYKKIHGHVVIPSSFTVPKNDSWPKNVHGKKLGQICFSIRSRNLYIKDDESRKAQLMTLGFDCDPKHQTTDTKFRKIFNALLMYRDEYDSVDVPYNFVVPHHEPWPKDWWDMKLGSSLNSIRNSGTYIKNHPSRRAMLESVDFDLTSRSKEAKEKRKLERALKAKNTEKVKISETDETFVKEKNGKSNSQSLLDSFVESMKTDHTMVSDKKKEKLEEDMEIQINGAQLPNRPKNVLETIKELTNDLSHHKIRKKPMETWPKVTGIDSTRKMIRLLGSSAMGGDCYISRENTAKAGANTLHHAASTAAANAAIKAEEKINSDFDINNFETLNDIYNENVLPGGPEFKAERDIPKGASMCDLSWMTEEERMTIALHGFQWDEFRGGYSFDQVMQALRHYKEIYNEMDIADDFIVPDDYEWPRDINGMNLGSICCQMRCGDIDARENLERKKELDEIGFDWKEKFGEDDNFLYFQWNEVFCGLYSCNMIRGEIDLEPDFVVPDENPWPLPLRGMPLGFILNLVRSQKDVIFRHYHDRFMILYGMGITWLEPIFVDWDEIKVNGVGDGVPLPGPYDDILEAAEHLKPLLI